MRFSTPITRVLLTGAICTALFFTSVAVSSAASISIKSPRQGATVTRTAVFQPKLSKAVKQRTRRVEIWLAGRRIAVARRSPFRAKVDTTALADGQHVFKVRALLRSTGASISRARTIVRKVKVTVSNSGRLNGTPGTNPVSNAPTPTTPTTSATPEPEVPVEQITQPGSNWNLVFNDEFDGTSLDSSKWSGQRDDWTTSRINDAGQSWSKGGFPYNFLEGAWYRPENNTVGGGVLTQSIKKLATPMTAHADWGEYKYTTGMVNSNHRFGFTYGYVEARMRVASCSGCWPAFWMLPVNSGWPPEIDIFEFFDSASVKFPYFSSHWNDNAGQLQSLTNPTIDGTDLTEQWHTYGLLWTEDGVQAFIDGKPGKKYTGAAVPHEDMYLIMQAAIGRNYATPEGAGLQTDYVRVYQQG